MSAVAVLTRMHIQSCLRSPLYWLGCLAITVLLALEIMLGYPTGASYYYGSDTINAQTALLQEQLDSGAYDTAPAALANQVKDELLALKEAQRYAQASSASDRKSFFAAIAKHDKIILAEYQAGHIQNVENELSPEATYKLNDALSQLNDPSHYGTLGQMPLLPFLASLPSLVPYALWLLPLFACLFEILGSWGDSFIYRASLPHEQLTLSAFLSLVSLSLIGLLCAIFLPGVRAVICNGMGDTTYPTIFIQGSSLIERTVLGQTMVELLYYLFLCVIVTAFGLLCLSLSKRKSASLILCAVLVCLQSVPQYSMSQMPWQHVVSWLPTSLFDLRQIVGNFAYSNGGDVSTIPNLSLEHALIVGSAFLACLFIALVISELIMHKRWAWSGNSSARQAASPSWQLSASQFGLAYGKRTIFQQASFEFDRNMVIGLVAPNGMGKTTLLKVLYGESAGRISGRIDIRTNAHAVNKRSENFRVFFVPSSDDALFRRFSTSRLLQFAERLFKNNRSSNAAADAFNLSQHMKTTAKKLSAGNKQLLNLAIAYMAQPQLLLLDEPMNALDPTNTKQVSRLLQQMAASGTTVVLSSHLLDNLEDICNTVFFIENKTLVQAKGGGRCLKEEYAEKYEVSQ